jgi:hypothetical protein
MAAGKGSTMDFSVISGKFRGDITKIKYLPG